jgi:hypothetical protein
LTHIDRCGQEIKKFQELIPYGIPRYEAVYLGSDCDVTKLWENSKGLNNKMIYFIKRVSDKVITNEMDLAKY